MSSTTGQVQLRAEHVDRIVKGFAESEYTMKDLVMTQSSNSWQETYYQESATELAAQGGGLTVKGVPRLASFPTAEVSWDKKSSSNVKHALEGIISWEDAMTNNVDVIARTLLKIARGVALSVDNEIYNTLSENGTAVLVNSVVIGAGYEWDSATVANRDPIQDILNAMSKIGKQNYNIHSGNGFIAFSQTDFANVLGNANIRNAGQFYTSEVTKNGRVGRLLGLRVIVSNSVADDKCLMGIAKECGTWKEAVPLTVVMIEDPGIKYTIRAWEIGVTQLTNPKALCLITNTQK